MKTSGRQFITRSKKGLTSPCKSCRRRIRPELLDKTYLCDECRNDPAAKWLAARTPQKPAPTDAPAKHKQGIRRRKKKVNLVTIRWVEPSRPIASAGTPLSPQPAPR